jgi:anti-sigma regulatory factor (Ser/Thr protein kinase)
MEARGDNHGAPLRLAVPDEPGSLARVRAALDAAASASGLGRDEAFDLKIAASEALANALVHATADSGRVEVSVASEADGVEVEVVGGGPFALANGFDASRGRGLPLMIALADEIEFASAPDGTRVRIRKQARARRRREPQAA